MSIDPIERVFGRDRQKMATGDHVEVFREAVAPGERRRYTKRFLATGGTDFRQWTDREWRILARLIGHGVRCVPAVVQYHGGVEGGMRELQTYDAGITVDQWATLLPVERDGTRRRHVFEDCAHWWALAHHCLAALDEIHALQLVHLDVKADNLCIPFGPPDFDPADPLGRLTVDFDRLALIDFAFSLVSRERLATSLPIGWQKDYDYQSPRLLRALEAGRGGDLVPTQELDWRCDLYSLAAMLRRYLPGDTAPRPDGDGDWTTARLDDARALVFRLRELHDGEDTARRPHRELLESTAQHLGDPDLARSIAAGWALVRDPTFVAAGTWVTPLTRIAFGPVAPTQLTRVRTTAIAAPREVPTVFRNPRAAPEAAVPEAMMVTARASPRTAPRQTRGAALVAAIVAVAVSLPFLGDAATPLVGAVRDQWAKLRAPPEVVPSRRAVAAAARTELASARIDVPAATPPVAPAPTTALDTAAGVAPAARRDAVGDRGADTKQPNATPSTAPTPGTTRSAPVDGSAPTGKARDKPVAPARRDAGASGAPAGVLPPATTADSRAPASSAAVKTHGTSTTPAAAQQRAVASLPSLLATPAAPAPYDPVAARRATERLAQLATRVVPATPHANDGATRPPPRPAVVPTPPTVQDPPAIATSKPDPEQVAPRADFASSPSSSPRSGAGPTDSVPAMASASAMPVETQSPAQASSSTRSRESAPPPRDRWRDRWQAALSALGLGSRAAAPVEERREQRSPAAPPVAMAPRPSSAADMATWPSPGPQVATTPSRAGGPTYPGDVPQRSRDEVPVFRSDANRAIAPDVPSPRGARYHADTEDDLVDRGRRLVAETVPVVAAQASADAAVPLAMASGSSSLRHRSYADATNVRWRSEYSVTPAAADAGRARELFHAAHRAYTAGRKPEAVELQLRAFAANPRDPDVAGFLAFLQLRTSPARPETARQLALHALTFSGSSRHTRFEDWNTFAVASALTGRSADATRAYLLMLALSADAERSCRAALRAQATFGEALRPTVEALSQRIRREGRADEAPGCSGVPM